MTCLRRPQGLCQFFLRSSALALTLALLLALGCAGSFKPKSLDEVGVLERAQEQERDGIRVRVAVPSKKEARALFSQNLYARGVQPVWIEIENGRDERAGFMPVGLDMNYFSPLEAANLELKEGDLDLDRERNQYYFDASLNGWLDPNSKRSGFIFTTVDEGTKAFNVDIVLKKKVVSFTFFVPVPGIKVDHYDIDFQNLYSADQILEVDQATLLAAIAKQPCCATDAKAKGTADPLNLIVIGRPIDVYYSFMRAGWDETETLNRSSLWKTVLSFLTGGEYRYSPVSSLYVYGRSQDVAFQKARSTIHERNHLRLWMSPARFEGVPVWIGQISRDIGVHFTRKTITTHKVDPNVDETREYLLEDLAYAQALAKFGYAEGVGEATIDEPRGNLTGDPYFTDGYRLVLWVTGSPVDIADVENVEWSIPPHQAR
jgi:hypothetical protein